MTLLPLPRKFRRILVISWGFWGDAILLTPFLKALRKTFPEAWITLCLGISADHRRAHAGELLAKDPTINAILKTDAQGLAAMMQSEPYDLAVDFCDSAHSRLLAKVSGARFQVRGRFCRLPKSFLFLGRARKGKNIFRRIGLRHRLDRKMFYRPKQFLEIAAFLGAGDDVVKDATPRLILSQDEEAGARQYLKKRGVRPKDFVVGMHPGGNMAHRLWQPENYGKLARRLIDEEKARVLVFYGPGERACAQKVLSFSGQGATLIGEKDPRRFMALVKQADVFISSVGGPLQIALACGISSVGIFWGKKDACHWYDIKKRKGLISIFKKRNGGEAEVEEALRGIKTLFAKRRP
jgi:heptosyltransferase-2